MARLLIGFACGLGATMVGLIIPQVLRILVDGPLVSGDRRQIALAALVVLGLGGAEALLWWTRRWFVQDPMLHVENRLRSDLFSHLQDLPASFHDHWQSGQLLARASSDISRIRSFLAFSLSMLVVNVTGAVVGIGYVMTMSFTLGLVYLACMTPAAFISFRFARRFRSMAALSRNQASALATQVDQSIHGIRVIKAFGRGRFMLDQFGEQAEELRETQIAKSRTSSTLWMWLSLIPQVAIAACLGLGIALAAGGELTVGQVVAFAGTATFLQQPINSLGFLFADMVEARTATDRYFEIMDTPNDVLDPADPIVPERHDGEIDFEGAHFRFPDAPDAERDLLDGVDLTVRPGETLALVGMTGAGKSALMELVPRLFDVTAGAVRVDGADVRSMTRRELRTRVAMAFEEPTLFSQSVRDNVLLGRPDASEDDLREAIAIAHADFAYELPDGLDTIIGEEGHSLSGGQRQRLALARAIAARADALVLDDPLSALDVNTEAEVEDALRAVLRRTTALIVAHRPSTVSMADRVALLDHGRIVGVGTHTEMLASSALYRHVISTLDDPPDAASRLSQPAPRPTRPALRPEQPSSTAAAETTGTDAPIAQIEAGGQGR